MPTVSLLAKLDSIACSFPCSFSSLNVPTHPLSSHPNSTLSLWIIIPFDFLLSTFQFRNLPSKYFPLLLSVSLSENVSFLRAGLCLLYSLLHPQCLAQKCPPKREPKDWVHLSFALCSSEPGAETGPELIGASESMWNEILSCWPLDLPADCLPRKLLLHKDLQPGEVLGVMLACVSALKLGQRSVLKGRPVNSHGDTGPALPACCF